MATAMNCYLALPSKFNNLSIRNTSSSASSIQLNSTCLTFSTNLSHNVFSNGYLALGKVRRSNRHSVVCEVTPGAKPDSAAKRARQAEKRRVYNKSKKSEVKTRMKKDMSSWREEIIYQ